MTDGPLKGRKVLVTGGSRGIGASCVRILASAGANVGFTYLNSVKEAKDLMGFYNDEVVGFRCDTSDEQATKRMVEEFGSMGQVKGIHGLVVNAGVYQRSEFRDISMSDWNRTLNTNLTGAYVTIKQVLPLMEKGSIVLISSQLAFKGSSSGADYGASKAGLLGLGRSLARELAPSIRVNTISPGFIDTDILAGDDAEKRRKRIDQVPLGRIGTGDDVAKGVLFLLSDGSSYITGADLDVNGGLYIH